MLTIEIPAGEYFDGDQSFFYIDRPVELALEHSLLSVSKWEAKWHIPYLGSSVEKTPEQILDYIRCMTISKGVDPDVYRFIGQSDMQRIAEYISNPMTATTISEEKPKEGAAPPKKKIVTSEVIYSWMVNLQIPVEFEKWHLNRLLMLIRVLNEENKPKKKMSNQERAAQRRATKAKNRAKMHRKK